MMFEERAQTNTLRKNPVTEQKWKKMIFELLLLLFAMYMR
jgi:hypothetical protein